MQEVYKRIVKDGHTLGMHSFSNKYSTIYASTEAFEQDFDKISSYLKDVTGVNSLYYRFPGGSSNEISNVNMAEFVRVLNEKELHTLTGTFPQEILHRIIRWMML